MGPMGLEMGPEGPVCHKVFGGGRRTGSRLSFKDILPMREEEDLLFLCMRSEMET